MPAKVEPRPATMNDLISGGHTLAVGAVVKVFQLGRGDAAQVAAWVGKKLWHQAVSQWTARAAHHRQQLIQTGGRF
ncbi:hypothetical protein TYRP_021267 [Tyrophagus putrescentiae]|nr:hypothetical protein TYRP_021267 [Tyrophagus putrescentiae]